MKKSRIFLTGFILLWVVIFLVFWGVTIFKKSPIKKIALPGIKTEDKGVKPIHGEGADKEAESEAIPVRCYRVALVDFKDDLPVMGTVKGALEIGLRFEVNGVIESINFREGDVIYAGDLIATLDKKDAQLKVDYAASKLASSKVQAQAAEKKLQIFKNLYDIGGIIKAKLEEVELEEKSAKLQVESSQVELKSAESELKKTGLYAPRDGVLGSRDAEAGEFVTPNNKIGTLYDTKEVFIELGIVEKDIDKIALGQDVTATVDAYPGMSFKGAVDYVYPIIEGKSRTLTIKVRIQNPDALLLPGMFSRAVITVAQFDNAIVVPSLSLNKLDEGYRVFIVEETSAVVSRPVNVAYITTDYSVIESGLYEGEVVVVDTPQELKDGIPVKVIEVQEGIEGE